MDSSALRGEQGTAQLWGILDPPALGARSGCPMSPEPQSACDSLSLEPFRALLWLLSLGLPRCFTPGFLGCVSGTVTKCETRLLWESGETRTGFPGPLGLPGPHSSRGGCAFTSAGRALPAHTGLLRGGPQGPLLTGAPAPFPSPGEGAEIQQPGFRKEMGGHKPSCRERKLPELHP